MTICYKILKRVGCGQKAGQCRQLRPYTNGSASRENREHEIHLSREKHVRVPYLMLSFLFHAWKESPLVAMVRLPPHFLFSHRTLSLISSCIILSRLALCTISVRICSRAARYAPYASFFSARSRAYSAFKLFTVGSFCTPSSSNAFFAAL